MAFAPVTLTAEETELMQLLRKKGLSIRNLDPAKKGELRALLHDLHVARGTFEDCQRLLRQLPLRHREKQARKELALSVEKGQLWDTVRVR